APRHPSRGAVRRGRHRERHRAPGTRGPALAVSRPGVGLRKAARRPDGPVLGPALAGPPTGEARAAQEGDRHPGGRSAVSAFTRPGTLVVPLPAAAPGGAREGRARAGQGECQLEWWYRPVVSPPGGPSGVRFSAHSPLSPAGGDPTTLTPP